MDAEVKFACPRRTGEIGPWDHRAVEDEWRDGRCSFCGSMAPDAFLAEARAGAELVPTDKNYKVYVTAAAEGSREQKFYFQHLDEGQRRAFLELLNAGTLKLGYPGHFYVLPFFISRGRK